MAWLAPFATSPTQSTVFFPGSKSLTNRYLILAALGSEPAVVRHPLIARDTLLMARGLTSMGVSFTPLAQDQQGVSSQEENAATGSLKAHALSIVPAPLHGASIDVGLAGTVMRFLPAIAGFAEGDILFDGDPGARLRPVDPVVKALKGLGVNVTHANNGQGRAVLPLTVHGTGSIRGGSVEIDASASSQFVSALLLAAPRMSEGLELRHIGAPIPSQPHVDMTVEVLRNSGIKVDCFDVDGHPASSDSPAVRWVVHPGIPCLGEVSVEPDLSNAGPFLAAAMLSGGKLSVPEWPVFTTQAGDSYREIFARMGGKVSLTPSSPEASAATLHIQGPKVIAPIDIDMHDIGELVPTVAAVALFAQGCSALRNIGQLRGHETDRLAALTTEINRLGGKAHIEGDDLIITPSSLCPATVEAYADHRMATFGAIVGLKVANTQVSDIDTTAKTFPQFADMWRKLAEGEAVITPASVPFNLHQELPA